MQSRCKKRNRGATNYFGLIVGALGLGIAWLVLGGPKQAPPFETTSTTGASISFPTGYRDKIVLVDFWATWCGACMEELPNVSRCYGRYHDKGLDVIGISLDDSGSMSRIPAVENEKGMSWPEVCDGKGWDSRLAKMYHVNSIPSEFLVDGNTGKILAEGESLRGDGLGDTLAKIFAKRR